MDGLKDCVKIAVKNGKNFTNYNKRHKKMTTSNKSNLSSSQEVTYSKAVQELIKIFGGETRNKVLSESQKIMSDAIDVLYDNKLSPGTYQVIDINNILIAYAWFDEKEKFILIPQYGSEVLKKRVN